MTIEATETQAARRAWDAIADGYDRYVTERNMELGEQALDLAGVTAGSTFLDVAAGTGALSIPAARRGADVLAVDVAPVMLDRLERRARAERLTGVRTRVMDGHALDLPDGTVDVAGSQFGVILFPGLARGLGELARVTRPGGRVVVVTFGPLERVEFLPFFLSAVRAVVPDVTGPPADPPPPPFRLGDPAVFAAAMTAAGLRDVRITTTTVEMRYDSGRRMWDWITSSNPIGAGLVAGLSPDQGDRVRAVLDERLRDRALRNEVHIGVGRR